MFQIVLSFLCLLFMTSTVKGQIDKTQLEEIDSLFSEFTDSPPVAYGIVYQGKSFSNQFSSDEFVNKNPTQFRLGGMTPHFVAYAIALLEEKGLIGFNDKISTYLGETNTNYQDLTIVNLLSHNHGLPEYWSMKYFMGYDDYTTFTAGMQDVAYENDLERIYPKGERVSFSGTGAFLLTRIIEKVTDKSLHEFTQENMFGPLNMKNTYFTNPSRTSNIISYEKQGDVYEPQIVKHYDNGPAGLITTMDDLLIWFSNLSSSTKVINRKLDSVIALENGKEVEIRNGKITYGQQFIHGERGIDKIWDYGRIGGFANAVFRFPAQDLAVIILSKNGLSYNGHLGMQISDILLEDEYGLEEERERFEITEVNENHIEKFVGTYLGLHSMLYREIVFRNDTLRYYRHGQGTETSLFPINENELIMGENGSLRLYMKDNLLMLTDGKFIFPYERIKAEKSKSAEIDDLEGSYFCEDLGQLVHIKRNKDNSLTIADQDRETTLQRVDKNRLTSNNIRYKLIVPQLDAENKVIGIKISNDGLRNIEFGKLLQTN